MSERRYSDEEVREIFDVAVDTSEADPSARSEGEGLTLSEIQEVGLQVGVEPERIAEAALTLRDRRGALPRRKHLGLPVSVGRIIDLPRAVTEEEWGRLVREFRETFGAQGTVVSRGGVRMWRNGNLRAVLEPTGLGQRLRMETEKGGAVAMSRFGATVVSVAVLLVVAELIATAMGSSVLTGDLMDLQGSILPLVMTAVGGVVIAANAVTLPEWAREREGQMEYLAGRVRTIVPAGTSGEGAP